ncbi:MAG TPA: thrombospondin type 3 repeat-containing protein [Candidatus Limnocylindria bacterium]|jgi:hypothetical protein|nr:thrombospondin type 3 repeat-containing protein [Candidatus Limnocylindria bacterium]
MQTFSRLLRVLVLGLAVSLPVAAGLPLPSLTFYGLFLDEFGWPYPEDDYVEVYAEGVKIVSHTLSSSVGKDYNFILRVPYDTGGKLGDYSPDVISPGDNVTVNLVDNGTGQTVITTNFICNLPAGSVIRFNSRSGTDSLGDGLTDELRQWIWGAVGDGSVFAPSKVRATDDSDGDGVSNLDEFLAGTDPANPDDALGVALTLTAFPGIAQLQFFSVPGKTYLMQTGTVTDNGITWNTAAFASSPDAGRTFTKAIGTGHYVSAFVAAATEVQLYRVVVDVKPTGAVLVP